VKHGIKVFGDKSLSSPSTRQTQRHLAFCLILGVRDAICLIPAARALTGQHDNTIKYIVYFSYPLGLDGWLQFNEAYK
jgi:hypothetical protein